LESQSTVHQTGRNTSTTSSTKLAVT